MTGAVAEMFEVDGLYNRHGGLMLRRWVGGRCEWCVQCPNEQIRPNERAVTP